MNILFKSKVYCYMLILSRSYTKENRKKLDCCEIFITFIKVAFVPAVH